MKSDAFVEGPFLLGRKMKGGENVTDAGSHPAPRIWELQNPFALAGLSCGKNQPQTQLGPVH